MICEITTFAFFSLSPMNAGGAGDAARYVNEKAEEGRRRLLNSLWSDLGAHAVLYQLVRVVEERRMPNWDGYGAEPIDENTYTLALRFLEALPLGAAAPSVGAEPDGQLTLEWYRSPRQTLSVSVDPIGDLHYAALIGPNMEFGTLPFFGEVPASILSLMQRVTAA
jgi:hypothetical protein